jgi:hypothetical protein
MVRNWRRDCAIRIIIPPFSALVDPGGLIVRGTDPGRQILSLRRMYRIDNLREAGSPFDGVSRFRSDTVLRRKSMRGSLLVLAATAGLSIAAISGAATEENAEDFMQLHKVEITFHEAGTTKNLNLMLSLFADDAVLTTGGKTYTGKDQIKSFWQAAGTFQPQNQWVAYTPAFRIRYDVEGDRAHLYFECLYVDKVANKIAAHTNSDDTLLRVNGRWLIKEMKAAAVPEL